MRAEWRVFRTALRAWEVADEEDDEEALRAALDEAAKTLSVVVQTTQASVAGMSVPELLLVQGRTLDRLNSGVERLEEAVDDVHNTLSLVTKTEVCEFEVLDVLLQRLALQPAVVLFHELADVLEVLPWRGGHIVIGRCEGAVRPSYFSSSIL